MSPETPPGSDRGTIRELTRRGVLVERDGVLFHRDSVEQAAALAARLLHEDPAGFTVATFREQAGVSRKYALPLLAELDARRAPRRRRPPNSRPTPTRGLIPVACLSPVTAGSA